MLYYCVVKQVIKDKKISIEFITETNDDAIVKLHDCIKIYNTDVTSNEFYCINFLSNNKLVKVDIYKKIPSYFTYTKDLEFSYEIVEYEEN